MQNKLIQLLRQVSIKKRLFITLAGSILLPIILITIYSGYIASSSLSKEIIRYARKYNDVLASDINQYLKSYEDLTDQVIFSQEMQDIITRYEYMTDLEKANVKLNYGKFMVNLFNQTGDVKDLRAIRLNGDSIFSKGYFYLSEHDIQQIIDDKEDITFQGETSVYIKNNEKYLMIVKPIKKFTAKQADGFLLILLDGTFIERFLDIEELGEGARVLVLDKNNQPINDVAPEFLERLPIEEFQKNALGENNDYYSTYKIEDLKTFVIYKNMGDFKICTLIPDTTIKKTGVALWKNVILLAVVFIAIASIAANIISKSIIIPIYHVKDYIEASIAFHFNETYEDDGKDEIAYIGQIFTQIVEQIKFMFEKIGLDEREKREMEINMLQAQINPHFLFNTLNSLRFIAMVNGMENISQGIFALCEILRNTIIDHNSFVSIEEEINNIKNYVTIQKLRYEDSFEVEFDVSDSVKDLMIIKFLLQPIVENSIIHGLNEEGKKIRIQLQVREAGEQVQILISDNGQGFNVQEIKTRDKRLSGIGLSNVKERIHLTYGEEGSFEIRSEIGQSTTVEIIIPKQKA